MGKSHSVLSRGSAAGVFAALLLAIAGCGSEDQPDALLPTAGGGGAGTAAPPAAGTSAPTQPTGGVAGGATVPTAGAAGRVPDEFPTAGTSAQPVAGTSGMATAGTTAMPDDMPADCEEHYLLLANAGDNAKYSVPAGAQIHPKFNFLAPWGSAEVQAVKFKPVTDNAGILHHWILNGPPIESNGAGGATKFIAGWAPGNDGDALPDDVGMYLPNGMLSLDVHYYNAFAGSKTETDASGVDVCVIKNKANFRKYTAGVIGLPGSASAPAHATNFSTPQTCTSTVTGSDPVYFIGVSPHMHKLGVHALLGLTRAPAAMTKLHDGAFSFEEQRVYPLDRVEIKTGDKLTTTCTYTNPSDKNVNFGQDTEDEMCFNFTTYYPMGALKCGFAL